jgi:hypothetical protein
MLNYIFCVKRKASHREAFGKTLEMMAIVTRSSWQRSSFLEFPAHCGAGLVNRW